MHKDETWQVYAINGEPIPGEGWDSALGNPEKNDSDAIVGVAVVFLYRFNNDGKLELLWQKRSDKIDRFPGDYDISAGGHINLNEKVVDAAVREAREEIGAVFGTEDLKFVTMSPFNKNRFAWIYAVDWTGKEEDFRFDDKEVSEVKWVLYSESDDFRKKYAKEPLKKDNVTPVALEKWLVMQGLVDPE